MCVRRGGDLSGGDNLPLFSKPARHHCHHTRPTCGLQENWAAGTLYQRRIKPPKAARGHATSYSARIDGIVPSDTKITFLVKHVKLRARYGYGHSTERFPGRWQQGRRTPSKRRKTKSLAQVLLLVRVPLLPV